MKKILLCVCLCFVWMGWMSKASAATNPYPSTFKGNTNCTYYAWKMAYEKAGIELPGWGNANTWYESAKKAGYSVGTTPRANSIAIWTKCSGDCATYGHVGYVESVSNDGETLYIKDSSEAGMNGCPDTEDSTYKECIQNGVSEETDKICLQNAPRKTCAFASNSDYTTQGFYTGDITQFIYLDNAPKTPVASSSNSSSTPSKVEEVKKSSNAKLSELTLEGIDFDFDSDTLQYTMDVENEIEKTVIEVKTEDEKATVEGDGEKLLEEGTNEFTIKVTAEDGTEVEYQVTITRKEKEEEEVIESVSLKSPKEKKKSSIPLFVIIGISSLGIIILLVVLWLWKKNIKKERIKHDKKEN